MIFTVIRISILRLWHNRAELLLTFVVPIIFFSIFAWIFGSRDSDGGTPRIKVAIVDSVDSPASRKIIDGLKEARSLRVLDDFTGRTKVKSAKDIEKANALLEGSAADWVRKGMVTAAVVLKPGTQSSNPTSASYTIDAEVIADSYDQVASQILSAVVQKALIASRQQQAAEFSEKQQRQLPATETAQAGFQNSVEESTASVQPAVVQQIPQQPELSIPEVPVRDILGENQANPIVAMYAAGIAVMFSLFSTTTSSGSLLEERENSTLERLLCSRLSVDQLLMGKWCYLAALGFLQITLMFIWGALVFKVDLLNHIPGFVVMTAATSAAAASFALMIATACKTRIQLGWLSTIVILVMSALGGSMVPRYLMSESVQQVGMFTFNAWALEGYNKVFWRGLPMQDLNRELGVLMASAFLMLIAARVFITKWEKN